MADIETRLSAVEDKIRQSSFRKNKGLGNEVGYYVFSYEPEYELLVRERIRYLQNKYTGATGDFQVVVFDLYDIMIDILEEKGYMDKCFEFEKKKGFEQITKAVGRTLRLSSDDSLIVNHIVDNTPPDSVVFITGVGKCYPIIRSHSILNTLHQVLDRVPVVMCYPGKYDQQELILFGEIEDDNYYRAFPLV